MLLQMNHNEWLRLTTESGNRAYFVSFLVLKTIEIKNCLRLQRGVSFKDCSLLTEASSAQIECAYWPTSNATGAEWNAFWSTVGIADAERVKMPPKCKQQYF